MLNIKDKSLLLSLNFKGKGGKENLITKLFPSLLRKDSKKLDFICQEETIIYEAKKQQNLQWLNLAKFYNLSKYEQRINFLFICIDENGLVDLIFCIEKGDFLNLMIKDKTLSDSGWSFSAIEKAYELVEMAPKVQPKAGVLIRKFFKKNKQELQIIYEK